MIINTVPIKETNCISGIFKPEQTSSVFELDGLPFTPKQVAIMCLDMAGSTDANNNTVVSFCSDATISGSAAKKAGYIAIVNGARQQGVFGATSANIVFGENSFSVTFSIQSAFNSNYTYKYIVSALDGD